MTSDYFRSVFDTLNNGNVVVPGQFKKSKEKFLTRIKTENGDQILVDYPGVSPDRLKIYVGNSRDNFVLFTVEIDGVVDCSFWVDETTTNYGKMKDFIKILYEIDLDNTNYTMKDGRLTIFIPYIKRVSSNSKRYLTQKKETPSNIPPNMQGFQDSDLQYKGVGNIAGQM